jgi:hypothetical protein
MKKYRTSLILILLGCIFFGMYSLNGSYVAEDGRLVESFGYIPIGYFFIFIGSILACGITLRSLYKQRFP